MIIRWCTSLIIIFAACLWTVSAWAALDFTLTTGDSATNTQTLPSDSNNCPTDGPRASYVGGTVTNTGATTVTDASATLSGLASGFAITGTQSATLSLGNIGAGDSVFVGWHIFFPCDTSGNNQTGPKQRPI